MSPKVAILYYQTQSISHIHLHTHTHIQILQIHILGKLEIHPHITSETAGDSSDFEKLFHGLFIQKLNLLTIALLGTHSHTHKPNMSTYM